MQKIGAVVLGVALLSCGGSKKGGGLAVQSSPTGELEGALRVELTFDRPMVAADAIGPEARPPLSISPPIEGEARWEDDRTLVFVPTVSLPPSTGFVAVVPPRTRALDGSTLGTAHTFLFSTERLSGEVNVIGAAHRALPGQEIRLDFNQPVSFDEVARHCELHGAKKSRSIALQRAAESDEGPAKSYRVTPARDLPLDSGWTLRCEADLMGVEGNLGLVAELSAEIHTYGPLAFVSMEPSGRDIVPDEGMALKIAFTNPLADDLKLAIKPAVPGFPERCHSLGDEPAGLSCGVLLDATTSYAITVDGEQQDIFGQELGATQTIEFRTADADPTISMESGYFVAERSRPVLPVWTRNVKAMDVTAVSVTPDTFHVLRPHLNWWDSDPAELADSSLAPRSVKVDIAAEKNQWKQNPLDPAKLTGGKTGPGMYYVEIGSREVDRDGLSDGGRRKVLVNFTDIGLVSKLSPSRGLVWATRLSTGEPVAGAGVTVRNDDGTVTWRGKTDRDGLATLPGRAVLEGEKKTGEGAEEDELDEYYDEYAGGSDPIDIFVESGADWTMVNATKSGGLASWNFSVSSDYDQEPVKLRGFMHSDRGLYRPGETVHIKGLARETSLGKPLSVPRSKKVAVEVAGPRGKTVHSTEATLSRYGGFWLDFELPGDARLGDYTVRATLASGTFTQRFAVEEYRPATFEVDGKSPRKRVVHRGELEARIGARYFYGAPLREGDVAFTLHSRPRRVSFPKFDDFRFTDGRLYDSYRYASDYSQSLVADTRVALDDEGNAQVQFDVGPSDVYTDADLLIRASVTSPSNEVINKTFTVPYYRSRRYYGIKSPGYFLDVGKKQTFEIVGVNAAGKSLGGKARLTVTRRDWNCVWEDWGYRGSYQCREENEKILEKTLQLTEGSPTKFDFVPEKGGDYWVVVEGTSDAHAAAARQLYAWGDGGGSWRSDDSMTFDVIADKEEYEPGDTATLILKTDLSKAKGLVTIERDGVIERRFIEVTETSKHLKIPIEESYGPNVYVSVALVQPRTSDGKRGMPRMRMGLVNVPVRPVHKELKVSVETDRKDYRPGETVTALVKVTTDRGVPVASEVAVTAADEGVLSLIGYKTPDPVPTFYAPWGIGVETATQLAYLRQIASPNLERPATGGDSGGPGSVRSRFVSTAVWKPGVVTNAAGVATVTFEAPDNLTAFRIMAVAADSGHRFGSGEKRFTVSKPLQLHRALPRFATVGDELRAGVVVHNETGQEGSATVTATAEGGLVLESAATQTVKVPRGGRVPVLFSLKGKALEDARLTFSATLGDDSDAVAFEMPVLHPSPELRKHVAHGATAAEKVLRVKLPKGGIPASAELTISVDRDGLSGIEDGLRELIGYPYGCLEQTTSKVIPMLAVRQLAERLDLDGLEGPELEKFVRAGVAKIGRHQTHSGGFSLWPGGEPDAYYTAYALWGLHLAREAGYDVDQTRIDDGLFYLKSAGTHEDSSKPYYSEAGYLGTQAFSLYVRAMLGDKDTQAAIALAERADVMPVYGKAFLMRAMAAGLGTSDAKVEKLRAELSAIARKATAAGTLIEEPEDKDLDWYMSDAMRTTSIVLDGLVALDPGDRAVEPLVRALMKERRAQPYFTTQSNLYSLLALTSYAKRATPGSASVVVEAGGVEILSGSLDGDDRLRVVSVPLGDIDSLVVKPSGKVHYNVGLRYRLKAGSLKPESRGLKIVREYFDEQGSPKSSFRVGDVVRVRLTMPLRQSVSHLMVSDRFAAAFEPLNTRFATTSSSISHAREPWGSHRELRDERVDFATEYNWGDTYVREYLMRAIAEGTFVLPPAAAELMYEPEKHARTGLEIIEVKAR